MKLAFKLSGFHKTGQIWAEIICFVAANLVWWLYILVTKL